MNWCDTEIEALTTIFAFTLHLGPLSGSKLPTQLEENCFDRLCSIFFNNLAMSEESEREIALKTSTVNAMINLPAKFNDRFDSDRTFEYLLKLLQFNCLHNQGEDGKNLIGLLVILTAISKAVPRSRPVLKNLIFPNNVELKAPKNTVNPPPEYVRDQTISSVLLSYMTSSNPALSYYSAELLYNVCDVDASEFTRLTGLGNAAGLLASKRLFQGIGLPVLSTGTDSSESRPLSVDGEEQWLQCLKRIEEKEEN